ncbi:MAG TPA: hypothetical protein VF595_10765 [Tepidisphaeraceae bacterium]|jgi:hypothetical protein
MESKSTAVKSLNVLYPLALLLALGLAGGGGYYGYRTHDWTPAFLGGLAVIGVLVTWPIAACLGATGSMCGNLREAMTPVYERLEQFSIILNEMSEQQLLSEQAKTVAYREKDREALRRAIQEDVAKKDWEGALVLVDEMDTRFGYKQEAERIRQEINQRFDEHIRRQVHASRSVIERYVANQQWAAAHREADRMVEQFPTNEDARKLASEIESRRTAYKEKLLGDYNDMIARKDVDGAIATIRQLDFYLTPEEGAGMQESVRNVFKDKLNLLKDQFTDAVHRGDWTNAYRTGDQIVRDYPNTQMAREVRDKLESLKQRAAETATPAAVPAQ